LDIGEAYEVLSDQISGRNMTSKFWKQRGFQRQTTPRAKTWENRSSSSRIGTEEVDFSQFADFNSFVEQVLGRRQESKMGYLPQARAMCLVVLAQRNGIHNQFSCQPSGYRSQIDACRYEGGLERIRLEDGRSLEVDMPPGMFTVKPSVSESRALLGRLIPENTVSHPFFKLEGSDILPGADYS